MDIRHITYLLLIGLLFSCKAKNAQVAPVETNETASIAVPVEEIREEPVGMQDLGIPDSLFFSMERTACFGRCPIYKLDIYQSGYATYHGKNFVDNIGYFQAHLAKDKLQAIKDMALEIEYFKLNDQYPSQIADFPSTTTILNIDGRQKKVYNKQNAPMRLNQFQANVDTLLMDVKWIALPTGEK